MNEFQAFVRPMAGGYVGFLRTPGDGHAKPIRCKGGSAILFKSELEALQTVTKHLIRYVNGKMYRYGATEGDAISAADEFFAPEMRRTSDKRST